MAKKTKAKKEIKKTQAHDAAFVEEYLANRRNGKQAYKKLHPKATDRTAEVKASQLLRKDKVAAYLAEREQQALGKAQLTTDRVLQELARLAFFDLRRLYNEDGTLKAPHELDDDTAAALASIETEELFEGRGENREHVGTLRKVKSFDKGGAIRDAMKHLGLFEKDREQLGKAIGKAILIPAKQSSVPDP